MKNLMVTLFILASLIVFSTAALPAHFPHGKTVIYKYQADVKAGLVNPSPYASSYSLEGLLYIKHDITDPNFKNAYYVKFGDLKYGLYNGRATQDRSTHASHMLPETAKILEEPFMIIYDETNQLIGMKTRETETGWSKNMKKALASFLQLDLSTPTMTESPMKSHSFITMERNIFGNCIVNYNVKPKGPKTFLVSKLFEPKNCTEFSMEFNHIDCTKCHVEKEDEMSTVTGRLFIIEQQKNNYLIKKLVGGSTINYMPWSQRSEGHNLLTNQSLIYEKDILSSEFDLPIVDFSKLPMEKNISFTKPQSNYAMYGGLDLTFGRHVPQLSLVVMKVKKLLGDAADYLEKDHLDMEISNHPRNIILNDLLLYMKYMDLASLDQVFLSIQDSTASREVAMRNIYLEMIPYVGTTATCQFIRNVIRKNKVSEVTAVIMLTKLARYVRLPSEKLLMDMKDLLKWGVTISLDVRKASILCFATLLDKVYGQSSSGLDRYIQHFYDQVIKNPSYEMKLVYLKAMGNIHHTMVYQLLLPVIRGTVPFTDNQMRIRYHAISAVKKSLGNGFYRSKRAYELLWPILTDTLLPVQLRMEAYDAFFTMHQTPSLRVMMSVYWFMVYEKNQNFYNYHYTNLKSLANSVDPCMRPTAEMARKLLMFSHEPKSGFLSTKIVLGYYDNVYGHGLTFKVAVQLNELTGLPQGFKVYLYGNVGRKPFQIGAIEMYIEGADQLLHKILGSQEPLTDAIVKQILTAASQDLTLTKNIHVDLSILMNNRNVYFSHYTQDSLQKMYDTLTKFMTDFKSLNMQNIVDYSLFYMSTPTDIGTSTFMGTQIPNLLSIKVEASTVQNFILNVKMNVLDWENGEYFMSVYNPIVDSWNGVKRVIRSDISIPMEFSLTYNANNHSLNLLLPVDMLKYKPIGVISHAENQVYLFSEEENVLKAHCFTCKSLISVTKGLDYKKTYEHSLNLRDAGLRLTAATFDCENGWTPVSGIQEMLRVFSKDNTYAAGDPILHLALASVNQIVNNANSPRSGTCGVMFKVEPSTMYPVSEIDVNLRINIQNMDETQKPWHVLGSRKMLVHGTWNAKSASSDKSLCFWDMKLSTESSAGHLTNEFNLMMSRTIPDAKPFKICVSGQTVYPTVNEVDILNVKNPNYMLHVKTSMKMGFAGEETCPRDEFDVAMSYTGELTEEQKKHIQEGKGEYCKRDLQNPNYLYSQGLVPKTPACSIEAMRVSSLRKYDVDITYKKVPECVLPYLHNFWTILLAYYLPHVQFFSGHSEEGTIKMNLSFPMYSPNFDIKIVTPQVGYDVKEFYSGNPVWNIWLDNVHFSLPMLIGYLSGVKVPCTVYPNTLVSSENTTVEIELPAEWTLLSGDHDGQTFAVFARKVRPDAIAMKIYASNYHVEIIPKSDFTWEILIDGKVVSNHQNGIVVPAGDLDHFIFRITHSYKHIFIQCSRAPITVAVSMNSVSIIQDRLMLRGHVSGMCGRLSDVYMQKPMMVHKSTAI